MTQYSKHVEICVEISTITKENKQKIDHDEQHHQFHHEKHNDKLYRKTITNINTYEPNRMLELMLPSPKYKTATRMTLLPTSTNENNEKTDHDEHYHRFHYGKYNDTLYSTNITNTNSYEPNGLLEPMLPSPTYKTTTKMIVLPTNTPPVFLPMQSQLWQQPELSGNSHIGSSWRSEWKPTISILL